IGTADLDQADVVYKARVPNTLTKETDHRFLGGSDVLHIVETEEEFLLSLAVQGRHATLRRDTLCYVDYVEKVAYVKQPYGKSESHPHGAIALNVFPATGEPIVETLPLVLHPVWNFFDEFGLLLGVPRNLGEPN